MAAGEGQQVIALISKRLRTLRKKYNRIAGFEESISQGKTLNKDQEEIVRSKPVVAALIEELEKLRLPLTPPSPPSSVVAVSEEISLVANQQQKARIEETADEETVAAKVEETADEEKVAAKVECVISDGVNGGEVSKDNTDSSATSETSQGVTPSPSSENVEDEEGWTTVVGRRKKAPQETPQETPRGRGRGQTPRGRGRGQAPQGRWRSQAPQGRGLGQAQGRGRGQGPQEAPQGVRGQGRQGPQTQKTYNGQSRRPA